MSTETEEVREQEAQASETQVEENQAEETASPAGEGAPVEEPQESDILPELQRSAELQEVDEEKCLDLLRDVSLKVKVELGRGKMLLKDILRLCRGSVVELEKLAGDPLDIYANERLIARGEVLIMNENFCIRITEILSTEDCLFAKE